MPNEIVLKGFWKIRWYLIMSNLIMRIFIAFIPTILIPAIIIGFVINYFGLTIDSLLAIIFLGQFYIIWAQLEVALRQTRLSTLEYEPEFKIEIKKSSKPLVPGDETTMGYAYDAKLRNGSKHLARNVLAIIKIFGAKYKHKIMKLGDIEPDKSHYVYTFEKGDLNNNRVTIDFDYQNILGAPGRVTFIKDPEFSEFIGVERVKMPGILLNSFEMLFSSRKRI